MKKKDEAQNRINNLIRVPNVRLVGDNIEPGVYEIRTALRIAREMELDLVEISTANDVSICKVIDYGKWNSSRWNYGIRKGCNDSTK